MKIKNISVKPIRIGDVSLLPGETAQVEAVYADAVAFYISMGYVQEVAEKKTRGKAKNPDAEPDAIAEDTAEMSPDGCRRCRGNHQNREDGGS